MKVIITGRKIDISAGMRSYTEKKLQKLDKFFDEAADAQVTLSVEKDRQTAELTIYFGGYVFRAEDTTDDMYTSIDRAIDLIERQIRKNKTRLEKKLRGGAFDAPSASAPETEEQEIRIVKSKKHALKPMSPEEAVLQMNLLGHEFFVFHNDETDKIDIVYKRKDGNYGLIEAEA